MAFVIPEALKRVTNPMMSGIMRAIVTTDELSAVLPIEAVDGTGFKVDREGTLPSTAFLADAGTGVAESSGTDDRFEVQFRRLVSDVDIDGLVAGVDGGLAATQNRLIAKKAKATWRLVQDNIVNGGHTTSHTITPACPPVGTGNGTDGIGNYGPHLDSTRRGPGSIKVSAVVGTSPNATSAGFQFRAPGDIAYGDVVTVTADGAATLKSHNPSFWISVTVDIGDAVAGEHLVYFASSNNEFDGLWEMTPASLMTAPSGNGVAFDIGMLDALMDVQKVRENRAFVMNGKLVNKFFAANRALGGADPTHIVLPGYGAQVPTYRGIPILTNDWLASYTQGSGTVSDVALVSLNADEGLVLAAQTGGSPFTPDADPRTRSVLGFRIEDVGLLDTTDARRTRVKWYGAPVLKSELACAIYQGIIQT
jgi:hypothetical protein